MSLWAAVAAPHDCSAHQAVEQGEVDDTLHAHHRPHMGMGDTTDVAAMPDLNPGPASSPCCDDTCLSACLASGLNVLNLQLAVIEPVIPATHFKLDRSTQFLPGPSYPSLYRPPIAQI